MHPSIIQSVLRPIHPDCQEAFTTLTQIGKNIHLNDDVPNDLIVHENDDELSRHSGDNAKVMQRF